MMKAMLVLFALFTISEAQEGKSPGKWTTMLRNAKQKQKEMEEEQKKVAHTPMSLDACRRHLDKLKYDLSKDDSLDSAHDPDLQGGATESEFKGLYDIIRENTQAKTVCQTGFSFGTSALAFLCASSPDTHLITFDMGLHPKFKNALHWLNTQDAFQGRHHVVVGNTLTTLPQAATTKADWMHDRKCDIVFHDGAHTKDVVFTDLQNFRPLVSPGALLIMDDCSFKYEYYQPVVAAVKQAFTANHIQDIEDKYFPTYDSGGDLDWKKSRFVCQGKFAPDKEL
jgi:predicted O-methyltransferase YrrM